MWTLYAGFAYILAAMILTFVTGWQNWGPIEGSVVAGGPVLYVYTLLFLGHKSDCPDSTASVTRS